MARKDKDTPRLTPREIIAGQRTGGNPDKLLTVREEQFCQFRVAHNLSQVDAYTRAGYTVSSIKSGRANASQLANKAHIKRRLNELIAERSAVEAQQPPVRMGDGTIPPGSDGTELAFDPRKGTPEQLIDLYMQNARDAHASGKFSAVNAALDAIAELKGFIEKGKKPRATTPNKGNVDDHEADNEGAGGLPQINQFFVSLGRSNNDGSAARDITPVTGGHAEVHGELQRVLPHDRDNGPIQQPLSSAELARVFGTGVPKQTTE